MKSLLPPQRIVNKNNMTHEELVDEMKNGDVVICDGLFAGKIGHIVGVGSSEHSIKLLIDNEIERYEPDYALISITDDNKKALALVVLQLTTTQRVREKTIEEVKIEIEKEVDRIKDGDIKWVGLRKALVILDSFKR